MLIAKEINYDHKGEELFHNVSISLDSKAKKRIAIVGKNVSFLNILPQFLLK